MMDYKLQRVLVWNKNKPQSSRCLCAYAAFFIEPNPGYCILSK